MTPSEFSVGTGVIATLLSLGGAAISHGASKQKVEDLKAQVERMQQQLDKVEERTGAVERATDRILEKIDGLDRVMRHDLAGVQSSLQLLTSRLLPDAPRPARSRSA